MTMKPMNVPRGLIAVRADASPGDVKELVESLNRAFAEFKSEHTKQLNDVKQGHQDALQALKVDRISADIDRLQRSVDDANVRLAAAEMGGQNGGNGPKDRTYSEAFACHFRRGDVQASLNKGAAEEGGYLAPVEWDRSIIDKLVIVSPMRQICAVQTTSKASYTKLINRRGTNSGWVGEIDKRPETSTAKLAPYQYDTYELYANPAASQQMLDDAEIDLEAWLSGEVETEFALQEGAAFVAGDGNKKPSGFLTYADGGANAAKHPLGAIATVNSGAAAAITADAVIDIIYDLPSAYTGNARFVMNRNTQRDIRKLKNSMGDYLWQPSYVAGQPATLGGYPVSEIPDMPDVVANALPLAFGDFQRGYLIADRVGVRVLRDPYTNKPYVSFYTTKRVGGGLLNPEVLRVLKIGQ